MKEWVAKRVTELLGLEEEVRTSRAQQQHRG